MVPVFVIVLIGWFTLAVQAETLTIASMADSLRVTNHSLAAERVSRRLQSHYRETNSLPADLPTFLSYPEQADIRNLKNPWMGYQISNPLDDGTWDFQRAVLFQQVPSRGLPENDFLSGENNDCGTLSFIESPSWCYQGDASVWVLDTRLEHIDQMLDSRMSMRITMRKIGTSFSAHQFFPDKDGAGSLSDGGSKALAALVGHSGGPGNCSGTFTLEWASRIGAVPLDCHDLYTPTGAEVTYNFISPTYVSLVSEMPFARSGGDSVVMGEHINLSN